MKSRVILSTTLLVFATCSLVSAAVTCLASQKAPPDIVIISDCVHTNNVVDANVQSPGLVIKRLDVMPEASDVIIENDVVVASYKSGAFYESPGWSYMLNKKVRQGVLISKQADRVEPIPIE